MTQLALNNRIITVIEELAFYANFGCHSNLFNILRNLLQIETALLEVSQLKDIYKEISKDIEYQ